MMRHRMETFSALLAICAGNSPVPGEFTAQNIRKAGDLRRHRNVFFTFCAGEFTDII